MKNKVNNWTTPVYEKEENYDNPAGDIFRELKSDDIDKVMASGTANTYCRCYSGRHSCGRACTITAECPVFTVACC